MTSARPTDMPAHLRPAERQFGVKCLSDIGSRKRGKEGFPEKSPNSPVCGKHVIRLPLKESRPGLLRLLVMECVAKHDTGLTEQ